MIKLPGLIDPHVHLRTPGQEHKEDFFTGTTAALSGGFTTVMDMPNNLQPITTFSGLLQKREIAKKQIVCDVGFYFGSLGDNLEEFEKVKKMVFGLKLFLNETTGNYLITIDKLSGIFAAWKSEKPILVHAEGNAVLSVIELARQTRKKLHICHVSSADDLRHIINAKEDGLPITCGVTPHHLFLTQEQAAGLGPLGVMKPPIGTRLDMDFLWEHLADIDVIESDHAPHTKLEKESAPPAGGPLFGVPNLETTLPLLLTAVHEDRLSIAEITRLCHDNPAKIFGIKQNAEIVVDENAEWEIENEKLFTKSKWSPFNGRKVFGKVKKVYIRGKKVFENDKILVKPGSGRVL